jgi:hypothetical protein
VYRYDGADRLVGWTRFRDGATSRFAADGTRVTESDQLGRPLRSEGIRYQIRRKSEGQLEVVEVPTGAFFSYSYRDDGDMVGTRVETGGG